MSLDLEQLQRQIGADVLESADALESFRIQYLGRKSGLITDLFGQIKNIAPENRKEYGANINALKNLAEERIAEAKLNLAAAANPQGQSWT